MSTPLTSEQRRWVHDVEQALPHGRIGVAYSGGVDSSVLATVIARLRGADAVLLLLAVSPSLARREHTLAVRQARHLGLELVELATQEVTDPRYARNDLDRCYHCKNTLFVDIGNRLAEFGIQAVAYGENADDLARPDRPGRRAAIEHAVCHPLADAGLTKAQIRELGRALGVPSADKPASPCLASRIPHGDPVTPEKLAQIDHAEDAVLTAGFTDCRVRHHGETARIEVPEGELHRLADPQVRSSVLRSVREVGFTHVTVDLAGIRSGVFTLQLQSGGTP
ncbi:ATP-dependent sacrificial sulfur transferase LarE [Arachnia propionica]|uniref:ATP-dependent sacrificial sulfur transferase LarE n=1 Tax=Arachnia propionica TaxID=1750 RepID=A0A3P1T9C6_9ACTN|nr:ATP-dependent sacrificial sulfur transferase LarE [Arachnia propionica]